MQVLSPDEKTMAKVTDECAIAIIDVATGKEVRTFEGHTRMIVELAFSPNGEFLASASADYTARIWKPRAPQRITQLSREKDTLVLRGHEDAVLRVAFSPCSRWLVTASADRTARIWDARRGNLIHTLEGHLAPVVHTTFSPDGKQIITASGDGEINIYGVEQRKGTSSLSAKDITHQHDLNDHQDAIYGSFFSPDAKTLVTVSDDGTAKIWTPQYGQLIHSLKRHQAAVVHACFSPDGKFLTTTSELNTESLWDVKTGEHLRSFPTFSSPEIDTPNATRQRVREWLERAGQALPALESNGVLMLARHQDAVTVLAFSPDGTTLATGSDDATIRLWNTADGSHQHTLDKHSGPITCLTFSRSGEQLVSGSSSGGVSFFKAPKTALIWSTKTGKCTHTCHASMDHANMGHGKAEGFDLLGLARAPNGTDVVLNFETRLALWDIQNGKILKTFSGGLEHLCYSPDGLTLATAYEGGTVRIINVWVEGQNQEYGAAWHGHKGPVVHSAFSPDGAFLATASQDRTVRIWDVARERPHQVLEGHAAPLTHLSFSPDGQLLATLDELGVARLWSVQNGSKLGLPIHEMKVRYANNIPNESAELAFSPDGAVLAVAGRDNALRLWDVKTGTLSNALTGHQAPMTSVAYSPDGSLIATSSRDRTARIWSI